MSGRYDAERAHDFRVDYALGPENYGAELDRQRVVAERAAWAMRDGGRDMTGRSRRHGPR